MEETKIPDFEHSRVLVPVELLRTLADAAGLAYAPAFGGWESDRLKAVINAAHSAIHILNRHRDGVGNGPMERVGRALMKLRADRVITQADYDLIYSEILDEMSK